MTRGRRRRAAGFSVTEVTTVLTALSILTGATAPAVNDYVDRAKEIRVKSDVRVVSLALMRMMMDTAPERNRDGGWGSYDLLVGAGAIPTTIGEEAAPWGAQPGRLVGSLDDQLIADDARYPRPVGQSGLGWRGPYLEERVGPDPWGHRFGVNVAASRTATSQMVVLSAGFDGSVESAFAIDGLPKRGDDHVALIASRGRP